LGQAGSVDLRRQALDLEALLFGESVVGGIRNLTKANKMKTYKTLDAFIHAALDVGAFTDRIGAIMAWMGGHRTV
jgi:hypothetical protein